MKAVAATAGAVDVMDDATAAAATAASEGDARPSSPSAAPVDALQATLNVGIIGHVAHGKSSLVRQLTGVRTQKHKDEQERNITIRLGYANCKLYRCDDPSCPPARRYAWRPSACKHLTIAGEGGRAYHLVRQVSFVDCPGHESLMQTLLSGAAVMDAAILLVAANEPCPAPQTAEHLAAASCVGLRDVLPVQNKLDLVSTAAAAAHHDDIEAFVAGSAAEAHGVTPICAQLGHNLGALAERLVCLPTPPRRADAPARVLLIRSFDVNRPGAPAAALRGGVAGGAVVQGELRVGDDVEIRPGIVRRGGDGGAYRATPLRTRVASLHSEATPLERAVPGGLIGVGTSLDPWLTKDDRIKGQVLGRVGELPPIWSELVVGATAPPSAARGRRKAAAVATAAAAPAGATGATGAAAAARLGAQRAADAKKGRAGAGGRAPPRLHRSVLVPRRRAEAPDRRSARAAPELARVRVSGRYGRAQPGGGWQVAAVRAGRGARWRGDHSGGALARRRRRRRQVGGGG